jgi:hypothetical protein
VFLVRSLQLSEGLDLEPASLEKITLDGSELPVGGLAEGRCPLTLTRYGA